MEKDRRQKGKLEEVEIVLDPETKILLSDQVIDADGLAFPAHKDCTKIKYIKGFKPRCLQLGGRPTPTRCYNCEDYKH